MAYTGYRFLIDGMELPYAPSELTVTIGSNNKTVGLINGDEINILKNPKLTEIEFEIELPRGRQYAFANKLQSPIKFTDYFEKLMKNKTTAELVIVRTKPGGGVGNTTDGFITSTWNKVTLEGYDLKESAENAFDIRVNLKFKEYIGYGTCIAEDVNKSPSGNNAISSPTKPATEIKSHRVEKGDTLWGISKKYYGSGSYWEKIWEANKKLLDDTAKKYNRADSTKGHWIYPGTMLVIPPLNK